MAIIKTIANEEIDFNSSPNEFVGYSNLNAISITAEEAIFHFGVRRAETPNVADGIAKIFLSLPHAKRVMLVLMSLISEHERLFGAIELDISKRLTEDGRKRVQDLTEKRENVATDTK
jgi:hypothetical protein